jgi:hypothetical protein
VEHKAFSTRLGISCNATSGTVYLYQECFTSVITSSGLSSAMDLLIVSLAFFPVDDFGLDDHVSLGIDRNYLLSGKSIVPLESFFP